MPLEVPPLYGRRKSPRASLSSSRRRRDAHPPLSVLVRRPVSLFSLAPPSVVLFFAGALAGALGKTLVAPLDRVKILLQVKGGYQTGALREAATKGGVLSSLWAICKTEGILGFWKGNLPQLLRVVPYSAVQLGSYELLKRVFGDKDGKLTVIQRVMAGAAAGVISTIVTYPLDTLRFRLAVDPDVHTVREAARALFNETGLAAFYRGLRPAVVGIAPYMGLELASYDLLPMAIPAFVRGFMAAFIATSICYPLDTIRQPYIETARLFLKRSGIRRYPSGHISVSSNGGGMPLRQRQLVSSSVRSSREIAWMVLEQEGVAGMYRGFVANAIKNFPNKGIRLSTFDAAKSLMSTSEVAYAEAVAIHQKPQSALS